MHGRRKRAGRGVGSSRTLILCLLIRHSFIDLVPLSVRYVNVFAFGGV